MHCFFLQFEINLKLYCTVYTVCHVHFPNVFSPFDNEEDDMVLEKGKQLMGMRGNEAKIEGLENM